MTRLYAGESFDEEIDETFLDDTTGSNRNRILAEDIGSPKHAAQEVFVRISEEEEYWLMHAFVQCTETVHVETEHRADPGLPGA
eukprot:NODE_3841_length_738_cov_209.633968.p2 GENE.NODE_3841_length_738_cov_209.633968~~NODE_3841_length_738_cov_209.633968.p2  ORF type:complete len:84 (+),score=23.76 NODE_3841_length_738_cov_209.633968:50-301(+)